MGRSRLNQPNKKNSIVVIGAGMVGVSTALQLIKDGHSVSLVDPLKNEQAASYGNAGALNPSSVTPLTTPGLMTRAPSMLLNSRSPLFLKWCDIPMLLPWLVKFVSYATEKKAAYITDKLTPLVHDCLREHQGLAMKTDAAGFIRESDFTVLYKDKAAYEADQYVWQQRARVGQDWYFVEKDELKKLEPELAINADFAVRMKNHGFVSDPGRYLETLLAHFADLGGTVIKDLATDFVIDGNRISSVETENQTIDCEKLIISAGVWSGRLMKNLGINVPMESERGYHIEFIEPSFVPKGTINVMQGKFFMTPMDGRLRCTSIVEFADIDAPVDPKILDIMLENIRAALPDLTWKDTKTWMGRRPSTIDSLPVIGKSSNFANLYLGFGHHHIGLMSGPKTGRILADIISGRKPDFDISAFDISRYQ